MRNDSLHECREPGVDVETRVRLRSPSFVKTTAAVFPIGLAVVLAMAVYFPTFFRPAFLFAAIVLPPFVLWSLGLYAWAAAQTLTGDEKADRDTCLRATDLYLAFVTVGSGVYAVAWLLVALHALLWGEVVGWVGYTLVTVSYFVILVVSFLFPNRLAAVEEDRLSPEPTTVLGRLLSPSLRVPHPAAVAGPIVAATILLRGILEDAWKGAIVASACLAIALFLIFPMVMGFDWWRRLRGRRQAPPRPPR
jgi:hypothetical protein